MIAVIIKKLADGEELNIEDKLELTQFFERMQYIPAQVETLFKKTSTITALSQITNNTGTQVAGTVGGWVLDTNKLTDAAGTVGMDSTVTVADDVRIWAGNVTPTSAPFRVTEAGALVATSATITGSITATTGAIGGWTVDATSIKDTAGVVGLSSAVTGGDDIRFFAGNVTPASAPFRVTEAGVLTSTSASIAGWTIDSTTIQKLAANVGIILDSSASIIKVGDTGGTYISIDGANKHIQSSNYVAGSAGFHIDADSGDAEFNKITARGMIKTAVFEKDTISAIGGSLLVLDADVLATTMTAADNATVTIEGNTTFAVGDILRMKDDTYDEWLEVTVITSAPTYTVTRDKAAAYGAGANPAWKKGQAVVNYGGTGNGGLIFTSGATPSLKVFNHTGSPWTTTGTPVELSESGIIISGPNTTPYLTFKTEAGATVATVFQDGAGNLQFDQADDTKNFTFNDGSVICLMASGHDPSFSLHENNILKANMWWDASDLNLILTNQINTGGIVFAVTPSAGGGTGLWVFRDGTASVDRFRLSNNGGFGILETASAPAYEADYAKIFYLDTGKLQVRHKQGATETEFTLGNITDAQATDLTDGGETTLHSHAGSVTAVTGTAPIVSSGGATPAISINMSAITNSLAADVALNNTANYFDGPSVAQGTTGKWFASGHVLLNDTAGSTTFYVKLWDGTTVISCTVFELIASTYSTPVHLSGYIDTPAGNIRISVRDVDRTTGVIYHDASGIDNKDSTLTAIRIG